MIENTDKKVGKVILVAPWLNPENNPISDTADFFNFELDPKIAHRTAGFVVFNSDNDMDTIHKSVEIIRNTVKNVKYREFHNHGHFCFEDLGTEKFPELRDECLNAMRRTKYK